MKKKILVVEHNDDLRAILLLWLTHMGYQAIEAHNSKEAIACAEAEQPALIFMDLGLPDCDGIKTSIMLKQNRKTSQIPIVALTAWMSELRVEKASRAGIETYLVKPGSPQTLKKTIEKFTANPLPQGASLARTTKAVNAYTRSSIPNPRTTRSNRSQGTPRLRLILVLYRCAQLFNGRRCKKRCQRNVSGSQSFNFNH